MSAARRQEVCDATSSLGDSATATGNLQATYARPVLLCFVFLSDVIPVFLSAVTGRISDGLMTDAKDSALGFFRVHFIAGYATDD